MSNKRIGVDLGLSEFTVKSHFQRVVARGIARNRAHLVAVCIRSGDLILDPTGRHYVPAYQYTD